MDSSSRPKGSHPQDRTACPIRRSPSARVPSRDPRRRRDVGGRNSQRSTWSFRDIDTRTGTEPRSRTSRRCQMLLRKEVIQPHLPVRLPCYDFTPIAGPTFGSSLQRLGH